MTCLWEGFRWSGTFCHCSGLLSSSQSRSSSAISPCADAEASERFDEAAGGILSAGILWHRLNACLSCSLFHHSLVSMDGCQVGAFDGTGACCAAGLAESVLGFLEGCADGGGVLGGVGVFPCPLVGA